MKPSKSLGKVSGGQPDFVTTSCSLEVDSLYNLVQKHNLKMHTKSKLVLFEIQWCKVEHSSEKDLPNQNDCV